MAEGPPKWGGFGSLYFTNGFPGIGIPVARKAGIMKDRGITNCLSLCQLPGNKGVGIIDGQWNNIPGRQTDDTRLVVSLKIA